MHHPSSKHTSNDYTPDLIAVDIDLSEFMSIDRIKSEGQQSRDGKPLVLQTAGSTSTSTPKPSGSTRTITRYQRIPYPLTRSLVEMQVPSDEGIHLAISYAWYVLEASPNTCGLYVLSACPQDYRIAWVDASGPVTSPPFKWDNLEPLVRYLYSHYAPPESHFIHDYSVSPQRLYNSPQPSPWSVSFLGSTYTDCTIAFWSDAWGRRTTVFKQVSEDGTAICIKDAYRDNERRFREKAVLEDLHRDGIVPGVVRVLDAADVPAVTRGGVPITTADVPDKRGRVVKRTKTRLVMGSSGEPLRYAKTLGDLLKAIYDTVEGAFSDSAYRVCCITHIALQFTEPW